MKPKLLFSLLSFLFFFSLSLSCFAQKYQPMAIEGAHWIVQQDYAETLWGPDHMFSYTVRGDSTWQGKIYKKIYIESLLLFSIAIF